MSISIGGARGPSGPAGPTGPGLSSRNIQYVASAADGGNDANDGFTWATAKATVYAAWLALGPSSFGTGGDIYVHDNAYWNPDPTVGLWITRDLTGLDTSKWLPERNVYIHGAAKARSVAISRQPQAMVLGGSTSDRDKPGLWVAECGQAVTLENIAFANNLARPILLGTRLGGNSIWRSDKSCSFIQLVNVSAFCGQGTQYGPCVDVGFGFWNNFKRCTFTANNLSAAVTGTPITNCVYAIPWNINVAVAVTADPKTAQYPSEQSEPAYTLTAGQRVLLVGQTTLAENGTYTWNSGAPMTKVNDDPVGSVVTITDAAAGVAGGRYTGTQFVKRASGYYEWMSTVADRKAGICFQGGDGWTFSADDMNMVYAGIRMNTPAASFRGQINWLTGEGTVGASADPFVQLVGTSFVGSVLCTNVVVADLVVSYEVYVDPRIPSSVVTCMQVDKAYNATVMGGRDHRSVVTGSASPYAQRSVGVVNGKYYGQVDHARRLFGAVPVAAANLAKTDPTTWTGSGTITAGLAAPDGTTNAASITGSGAFAQVFRGNRTFAVGDHVIAGSWVKRTSISTTSQFGLLQVLTTGFALESGGNYIYLSPPVAGDGEWQWQSAVATISAIGVNPCDTLFNLIGTTSLPGTFYGPVVMHLPIATYTSNEAHEIWASVNSVPLGAPVGSIACMPDQVQVFGRLKSLGKAPTIASGAGVTATTPVVGDDTKGTVTVTVGGAPTAAGAVVCTVTFPARTVAPRIQLTPKNLVAATAIGFSATTTTTFTVSTVNALGAAAVATWDYLIFE